MSNRIELPGEDSFAILRDANRVPEKFRRKVLRLSAGISQFVDEKGNVQAGPDTMGEFLNVQDALIVALVKELHVDGKDVPVSVEELEELPGDVYDALQKATAPELTNVLPNFGVSTDPDSPTEPSNG